jgi:hypothetical protein
LYFGKYGISEMLNNAYSKYDVQCKNLAVAEITVFFQGRIIFKQCTHKKHSTGKQIYKLQHVWLHG